MYMYKFFTCTEFFEALTFPKENIYAQFENKWVWFYRQIGGIPVGTNCALLKAN